MIQIVQGRRTFLDLAIEINTIERGIQGAIAAVAKEARADLIQTLRTSKSGRRYGGGARRFYKLVSGVALKKRGAFKAYQASAPGEAPATFTGVLARSVRAMRPRKGGGYTQMVFVDRRAAFYRHMLEFGTKNILPRKFMAPLVEHYDPIAAAAVQKAVDQAADKITAGRSR